VQLGWVMGRLAAAEGLPFPTPAPHDPDPANMSVSEPRRFRGQGGLEPVTCELSVDGGA
jgi:hypothetical protein